MILRIISKSTNKEYEYTIHRSADAMPTYIYLLEYITYDFPLLYKWW